jgi:hypothetical protein
MHGGTPCGQPPIERQRVRNPRRRKDRTDQRASASAGVVAGWRTHSHGVLTAMEKRAATSTYVSVLSSYVRTARSRSSIGYGFGMRAVDHDRIPNSTDFWA